MFPFVATVAFSEDEYSVFFQDSKEKNHKNHCGV